MPLYLIERDMPGIGALTDAESQRLVDASTDALDDLGGELRWFRSFVTDNRCYCIYYAPNPEVIRQHARKLGVPVDRIAEVRRLLDPDGNRAAADLAV